MATVSAVAVKIRDLEVLKAQKDDLKEQLAALGQRVDQAQDEVISMILDLEEQTGVQGMRLLVDGRNYSVTRKSFFSIPKDARDEAFPLLRELGHGDLIVERVDDRSLSKELAAVMEANGGELPEEYQQLGLTQYDKNDLRSTKA